MIKVFILEVIELYRDLFYASVICIYVDIYIYMKGVNPSILPF